MNLIFYFIVFVFGTCLGSFLNCLIYRLEIHQSFLKGRSFCPKCHHILKWFDLIPILSFIFLKGKCRYCGKKISWQYPMVEAATGILFILIFWHCKPVASLLAVCEQWAIAEQLKGFGPDLIYLLYLLFISCLLIVIFVYDLKHYIIPDKVIYPAIAITFLYQIIFNTANFYSSVLSALGASGFFFLIWLVSRGQWMGFGDVKLTFFMGLFLGFPNILTSLFSAFLIGAIMGLGLIVFGKKTLKSQIPFGPFLVAGVFVALFWGQNLINWYLNLLTI